VSTPAHEVETIAQQEATVPALPPELTTVAPAELRAPRPERDNWLIAIGHAGVIWLAVYGLLTSEQASVPSAVLFAALITGVWLSSMSIAAGAASRLTLALGETGAVFLSVLAGLFAVSAVALWVPGLHLQPLRLLVMATAITVLSAAWKTFVSRGLPQQRRVLIVGGGEGSLDLVQLLRQSGSSFEPIGVVDDDADSEIFSGIPVRGQLGDLSTVVEDQRPDLVVLCVERNRPEVFKQLLASANAGFQVVGLPELYEHAFGRVPIRQLTPAWFMSVLHLYQRPYTRIAKRTFDFMVALIGLLITSPLLPVIALIVAQSKGPVIYRQKRLGEGGRIFTMYKFRTMRVDAEDEGSAEWAKELDPRATRAGRWLRRARLDELPQLWNVLKGDMSIVGPRPERPEFSQMLEEAVPFWAHRQLLKPGITGWAQLRTGYSADFHSTEEKLSYDLWYLRHRSMLLDIIICAKTLPQLLSGRGAR
jgi:exopolysaccharide biosynthesis polyprenyl glycosylphosphotransferase